MTLAGRFISSGDPARPLVACPLMPGKTKSDPKPLVGKAIILRIDCSVQAPPYRGRRRGA
jgi:hypothetical protein